MDCMNKKSDNGAVALRPADYQTELVVEHLDRNDEVLIHGTYTLEEAFPINM